MRAFVEAAQDLAEDNQQAFTGSSLRMKLQLYLIKILPTKVIRYFTDKEKMKMKDVANRLTLEPMIYAVEKC